MLKLYGRVAQRRVLAAATQPSQKRDEDLFNDIEKQVREMFDGPEGLSDQVRNYCILALLDVILLSACSLGVATRPHDHAAQADFRETAASVRCA